MKNLFNRSRQRVWTRKFRTILIIITISYFARHYQTQILWNLNIDHQDINWLRTSQWFWEYFRYINWKYRIFGISSHDRFVETSSKVLLSRPRRVRVASTDHQQQHESRYRSIVPIVLSQWILGDARIVARYRACDRGSPAGNLQDRNFLLQIAAGRPEI